MSYGTDYLDIPTLKPVRVGRVKSMTKTATTKMEVPAKSYSKTRGEHFKDIIIAILVVGVIAFIAGVHYSDNKNAQMTGAIKSAQATAVATPAKK